MEKARKTQKSQEIDIKFTITDYSNFYKRCSRPHFLSFLCILLLLYLLYFKKIKPQTHKLLQPRKAIWFGIRMVLIKYLKRKTTDVIYGRPHV